MEEDNGLFTIPQEELEQISWQLLLRGEAHAELNLKGAE